MLLYMPHATEFCMDSFFFSLVVSQYIEIFEYGFFGVCVLCDSEDKI